jgi:hypothetical protein
MVKSLLWEANSHATGQKIPHLLWALKVQHYVCDSHGRNYEDYLLRCDACDLVGCYLHSGGTYCLNLLTCMFFQNVDKHLSNYMVSHPTRPYSSFNDAFT